MAALSLLLVLAAAVSGCPEKQARTGVVPVAPGEAREVLPPDRELLLERLSDPDPRLRVEAAAGLVERYRSSASLAVPLLIDVLPDDESSYANCSAALLLAELVPGSLEAGAAVLSHAEESNSWRYQEAAARALRCFNINAVDEDGLLRILRATDHPIVLTETGRTLVHFHPEHTPEVIKLTHELLNSDSWMNSAYEDMLRVSLERYESPIP